METCFLLWPTINLTVTKPYSLFLYYLLLDIFSPLPNTHEHHHFACTRCSINVNWINHVNFSIINLYNLLHKDIYNHCLLIFPEDRELLKGQAFLILLCIPNATILELYKCLLNSWMDEAWAFQLDIQILPQSDLTYYLSSVWSNIEELELGRNYYFQDDLDFVSK